MQHTEGFQQMVKLTAVDLESPEEVIVQQMMEQFTTVGFAQIKNFKEWDEEEHFNLIQALHNLPATEKDQLKMRHHNSENKNKFRGLVPFLDNDPSHKELFDMGLPYHLHSEEEKQYSLVEVTPFPQRSQYEWIK